MNNKIVLNDKYIDCFADDINLIGKKMGNVEKESTTNFKPLKMSNLYGKGADKIERQLASVEKQINRVHTKIKEQNSEMFQLELLQSKKAMEIEIPTGFETNDSIFEKEFKDVNLLKDDGRSVNDGDSLREILDTVSYDTEKENLENINNENDTREEKYDDTTVVKNTSLNSINIGTDLSEEKIDFDFNREKENLENINIGNDTEEEKYSYTYNINYINLNTNNIDNKTNIAVKELDDKSSIEKKNLIDLNNNYNNDGEKSNN